MIRRGILLVVLLAFLLPGTALLAQQTGGQFCVRAFEDRNANSLFDPGEPVFIGGISADLINASGIIVESKTLDDSPTANSGTLCFQFLAAGQYTLAVSTLDYQPTTATTVTANITVTTVERFDFGAQRIFAQQPAGTAQAETAQQRLFLEAIFWAGLGAAFVMGVMAVIGAALYYWLVRRQNRQALARLQTGTMRQVSIDDSKRRF